MTETGVVWEDGTWLNEPPSWYVDDGRRLVVTAAGGSDAWRETSYGFIRDSAHALLFDFAVGSAVEVEFGVDYRRRFDQAGLMLRGGADMWIKSGVEISDGEPQLSAVVTDPRSDWSMAPVPEWAGGVTTVRASREGSAVTLRARIERGQWRMLRVAPVSADLRLMAGPYCCAPEGDGLVVTFPSVSVGPADRGLHEGV